MKLPRHTFTVLALVAFVALLGWLGRREPVQLARLAAVSRGPLQESFVEEGKTRLAQRYVIAAPLAGTLERITLEPGDAVQAGQTVAAIAPAASALLDDRARAQARAEVRSGQASQSAARQRISAARAASQLAAASLTRARALQTGQVVSQEALDKAAAAAATAAAELAAAQADEQAAAARVAAAQAILAHEGAAAHSAPLPVTAPVAGVVVRRHQQSATPVAAGQSLLEIGDVAQVEIEVPVLSADAVRLRPGMRARVLRWGGPGALQASVTRVQPGAYTKVSALGVEEQRTLVILRIESERPQWQALGDAYRVEVQFITDEQADAVQAPASALVRQSGQKDRGASPHGDPAAEPGWAIYRVTEGRARLTPVKVGLRSDTAVQILEGLAPGDTVIIQPDDRIRDGVKIKGT